MKPIAKEGDQVVGTDTHIVMIPSPGGPVPTPLPHPFVGKLDADLCETVMIENKKVALVGSKASNMPPHIPQGGPFQKPPADKGTISMGSSKVMIDNKAVARMGDPVTCCNDPADLDTGSVIAAGKVLSG